MCNIKIHETQPLLNLKLDRVMQDIVYKLVPGLQESMSTLLVVRQSLRMLALTKSPHLLMFSTRLVKSVIFFR